MTGDTAEASPTARRAMGPVTQEGHAVALRGRLEQLAPIDQFVCVSKPQRSTEWRRLQKAFCRQGISHHTRVSQRYEELDVCRVRNEERTLALRGIWQREPQHGRHALYLVADLGGPVGCAHAFVYDLSHETMLMPANRT